MQPDHDFRDYSGRLMAVLGLGLFGGGVGAVQFLCERGARVRILDTRSEQQLAPALAQLAGTTVNDVRLGRPHVVEDVADAELVVVNPAVSRRHPVLEYCRRQGIPQTSEMNLFWQWNRGRIVAVTGSNGKSTTTALLHEMLQVAGRRCWLGGNLGRSLLPMVDQISAADLVVLELSSFQLSDLNRLQMSPHVGVVTNFSPNHLDWHTDLADYRAAKQTMFRWQTSNDWAVVNADDADVSMWPVCGHRRLFGLTDRAADGCFLSGTLAVHHEHGQTQSWPITESLSLPGRHNLANALAAATAALAMGATVDDISRGLRSYCPLPHRLQLVAEAAGRRFYNDSLATTPESTIAALEAFSAPIHLIAGGYDKKIDLQDMATAIARKTKSVTLIGQTARELERLIQSQPDHNTVVMPHVTHLKEAFQLAAEQAQAGEIVLLSPGNASYDWFQNFEDRGQQFTRLAEDWQRSHTKGPDPQSADQ